jgi:sulfhydrogenase subunit gamma (sulfur reductase)
MSTTLKETLMDTSVYLPVQGRIQDVSQFNELTKLFTIELPDGLSLNHLPGQFVQASILGVGEAPISITSSPSRSNGSFQLCVRKAGDFTGAMHRLEAGDSLGVRGPFGHGFPFERFRGKDLLFAPGGIGLPPLRSLINQVLDDRSSYGRVIILYGARNPSELLFKDELEEWDDRDDVELLVTVDRGDEGWKGNVGVITTLFPKIKVHAPNTLAITCGPQVMYRFVLAELLSMGIREGNIYLDMERRMKCGIGKCGHCQINHEYTCKDGPCFSYAQLKTLEEGL